MYDFYKVNIDPDVAQSSRKRLKALYSQIPETTGCMSNIAKADGCGAWCCEHQNPQVMYVEFLNTWHNILKNEPTVKVAQLVIKAVRSYLSEIPTKGCMMWDKKTKQCTIHHTRPMNCRLYGQVPEEEFKPRYERLKVLYQNVTNAVIRDQCGLVESNGIKPTKEATDRWQAELEKIEHSIGIPTEQITDGEDGSYRTFHDHILLRICGRGFLASLTVVKLSGTKEKKEQFIKDLVDRMNKAHPELVDTKDDDAAPPQIILEY